MSSGCTARWAAASSAAPTTAPRDKKSASENTPAAGPPCTAMTEHPAEFARRRERADRGDDRADLRRADRGDEPFGAVGDEQRHAVSTPYPSCEQRQRKAIGARLDIGVIEALVAKDDGEA